MKTQFFNTTIILAFSSILLSCSKPETTPIPQADPYSTQQTSQPVETPAPPVVASTASLDEGLKLIQGMDCLTCHKTDAKLIGPSYQEVAAKYTEADIDRLAQKIIEGGKGNWGDIPMAPHNGLSKDNAKLMVKYILSLKK
ncbi:c-type cytochrome [Chryseobacterium tructae]|uniref:C-type cytochrome n=1 Tax=Chryseobacterium tructae TaxID=1037380 RepID=A0ABV7XYT5_9FLAO|nr:c-type cytochrome [Chryseobacterium tructae]MDN3693759.1 c-type cytochrome [Chryseobacterium tructae]